ncbi:uncharacterized protein LOC131997679 [Stomoxys calcitrans]|uniref:uncharacterized protein LOC131997679 n=1 Tax=Stomoxys calcitrans TaxID=35570 RepID=UPI0027E384DD|nr:uncharacterized protein LOC131997679 [Stomoxys calcitrans]
MELHNLTCTCYTDFVKEFVCDLKKLTTDAFVLNGHFMLNRPMDKNAEAGIVIKMNLPKQSKILKFLDVKVTICDSLTNMDKVPLIKEHFNELMTSSTLPVSCPIKANVLYKINNYTITNNFFPIYTPVMDFNYTTTAGGEVGITTPARSPSARQQQQQQLPAQRWQQPIVKQARFN